MTDTERGQDIVGRLKIDVTAKGKAWKYVHYAEHRGHGIVAIYSYGPSREHGALVREAQRVMNNRFGVSWAVSSGGISGWPKDGHENAADYRDRTVETQTIFDIDAVGGPNRSKIKQTAPASADWHLNYLLGRDDYAADGNMDVYLTGPLENEPEFWIEKINEWCGDSVVEIEEITVRALSQGRYWFLHDGDPIVEYRPLGH